MLLPVATEFDEKNNTLFAETDELGTYCVLDMEVLLQTFGVNPDGSQTEQVEMQMYSAPTDSDKYCVTFVFDIRTRRELVPCCDRMLIAVNSEGKLFAFN